MKKIVFSFSAIAIVLCALAGLLYSKAKVSLVQPNGTTYPIDKVLMPTYTAPIKNLKASTLFIPIDKTVPIKGAISKETSELIYQTIVTQTAFGDSVYLLIDSEGGDIYAGRQIVEAIEAARGPVYTICVNSCASMAAFIFEYGTIRYVTPSSQLMFHPAYGVIGGNIDIMVTEAIATKRYVDEMENFVAHKVGITLKDYKYESATQNIYLEADQAINRKFADKVVYLHYVN